MNNQIDLNLLRTYVKVLELKSFTKAALAMKWPKSRVSKSITRLEQMLNTQLIKRTTRAISITKKGEEFYQKIIPHLKAMEDEMKQLNEDSSKMIGTIRLSAPEDVGHTILGDLISDFNEVYPEIKFDVILANDFIDLNKLNIDLVFRIGKLEDSNLIQKKIGNVELLLVATPEYLKKNGTPLTKKDLEKHKLLTFIKLDAITDFDPLEEIIGKSDLKSRFGCNSFPMIYNQMKKNKGIALIPDFYCREDFLRGDLIRVLPTFSAGRRAVHLIYSPTTSMPKRLRAFIDFASERLQTLF